MPIVASVTMKGCSRKREMMMPLMRPASVPAATATASAAGMPSLSATPANNTPPSATTEPTLRSMPPVRITISMPRLISPLATIWRSRLPILRSVKNASVNTAAIVSRRKKLSTGTSSRQVSSIPSVGTLNRVLRREPFGAAISAGRSLTVMRFSSFTSAARKRWRAAAPRSLRRVRTCRPAAPRASPGCGRSSPALPAGPRRSAARRSRNRRDAR